MLNQSVSEKSVKLLGINTWKKFQPSADYETFIKDTFEQIELGLAKDVYKFTNFTKKEFNGKIGLEFATAEDELVAKKLNDNIRRLFKVRPSDRHAIVKQTISLAKDSQPIAIARLDIKNFYESLDRESIIKFVTEEWLLSHQNRMLLKQWDKQLEKQGIGGLPRGMSLSSTLSEVRIRHFDKAMKLDRKVYFYARYVDDIIVFYTGNKDDLKALLHENLKEKAKELCLNDAKSNFTSLNDKVAGNLLEMDYLGYKLQIETKPKKMDKKRKVEVLISNKKINKIKNRIRNTFVAYNRDRRFNLLLARLRFLSANQYIIGDIQRTKLKSGIYYNYPLISDRSQLKDLDSFYKKLINSSKGPARTALKMIRNHGSSGDDIRLRQIESISFQFGFDNRLMNSFSNDLSKKIKRCW